LVANKINKELSDLVKKDGYENISQAIGINCK
jgi:dihydroorotate dehydrogenase